MDINIFICCKIKLIENKKKIKIKFINFIINIHFKLYQF